MKFNFSMTCIVAAAVAFGGDGNSGAVKKSPSLMVPAGSAITVRLNESISSKKNDTGDRFTGVLESALSANGATVCDKRSMVTGRVVSRKRGAHGDELALELGSIEKPDGVTLNVTTDVVIRRNEHSVASGAVRAGSTAALGTTIGAIAGGAGARRLVLRQVEQLGQREQQRQGSPSRLRLRVCWCSGCATQCG
jgi:hypothetical protein